MNEASLKIGDRKVLNRPTFLHNGIFVFQGCTVTIREIAEDGVTVEFIDREGNPNLLPGVQSAELGEVSSEA
ncbi:MAG: hypothetical protein RIF32_12910 [Leptospirales bacterium]|jgi:hypothetical protein